MKKLTISCLVLIILGFSPLFSQVKYTSDGKLGIGTTSPSSTVNIHGSSPMLEFSNTAESETGILFYDHGYESSQYSKILLDCDGSRPKLNFYVSNADPSIVMKGFRTTCILTEGIDESPYNDQGLVFDYEFGYGDMSTLRPAVDWAGNLGASNYEFATLYCDHIIYGMLSQQPCDISLKTHIREVKSPLQKITSIRGVQYDLTEEYYKNADDKLKQALLKNTKDMYGFIAQELEKVIPELVSYDVETEEYGVNMIGMIPILVEAVKAQQLQIDSLKSVISQEDTKQAYNINASTIPEDILYESTLYQNIPNPFDENTIIVTNQSA